MSFSLGKLSHLSFCVTADGFVCYISILFYSFAKLQWRLHIRQLSNSAAPQLPNVCPDGLSVGGLICTASLGIGGVGFLRDQAR